MYVCIMYICAYIYLFSWTVWVAALVFLYPSKFQIYFLRTRTLTYMSNSRNLTKILSIFSFRLCCPQNALIAILPSVQDHVLHLVAISLSIFFFFLFLFSLVIFKLKTFLSFSSILMRLSFLKSTDHLFCRLLLKVGLSDVSLSTDWGFAFPVGILPEWCVLLSCIGA